MHRFLSVPAIGLLFLAAVACDHGVPTDVNSATSAEAALGEIQCRPVAGSGFVEGPVPGTGVPDAFGRLDGDLESDIYLTLTGFTLHGPQAANSEEILLPQSERQQAWSFGNDENGDRVLTGSETAFTGETVTQVGPIRSGGTARVTGRVDLTDGASGKLTLNGSLTRTPAGQPNRVDFDYSGRVCGT